MNRRSFLALLFAAPFARHGRCPAQPTVVRTPVPRRYRDVVGVKQVLAAGPGESAFKTVRFTVVGRDERGRTVVEKIELADVQRMIAMLPVY